jgi:cysteine desulfurase
MPDKYIYLDNAAAAAPEKKMIDFFASAAMSCYANQEAVHQQAYVVRQKLEAAEKDLVSALAGDASALVAWGSSGTDLFNLLSYAPMLRKGNIVTALEHPALQAALKRTGAELRTVPLLNGKVDLEELKRMADRNTALVAIHHVQSETGIIQDLPGIRKIIAGCAPQALFFSDTIQSAGKLPAPWKDAALDIISVSGHKLGTPGGAALILRTGKDSIRKNLAEFFERSRSREYLVGRPDPAAMLTLAHAVKTCVAESARVLSTIQIMNLELRESLSRIELAGKRKIRFTIPYEDASPFILHITLPGYEGAVLVRMLSEQGITVSSGSACGAESNLPSPALTAMNYSKKDAFAALRISFWRNNSSDDILRFANALESIIKNY